jgi:hypothetical protein
MCATIGAAGRHFLQQRRDPPCVPDDRHLGTTFLPISAGSMSTWMIRA